MQRTRYTEAQKAEALRLVAEVGPHEAARRTGVSVGTVGSWASRAGVSAPPVEERAQIANEKLATWATRKVALGEKIGSAAETALSRLNERLDEDRVAGLRDLVFTLGVLVDKAQLLTGGATTRTETVVERSPEAESEVAKVLAIVRQAA